MLGVRYKMSTFGVNIFIRNEDKVLLIHRTDFDIWALPGGGIDHGESVEEAAVRETLEETGLNVSIEKLIGVYSIPKWRSGGDHCVFLECSVISGTIVRQSDETRDCRYFPIANLPAAIWPSHMVMLDDGIQHYNSPLSRTIDMRWPFKEDRKWEDLIQLQKKSGLNVMEFLRRETMP